MYISEKILKLIFILLIGIATVLSILTLYFYLPTLINRFGFNKSPSPDITRLLSNYNITQTPEIYKAMDEKVAKIAQSTPSIDISNCTPYPRIAKVNIDKPIKITNSSNDAHTLVIDGHIFEIKKGSSAEISLSFVESDPIIIPYSCDDLNSFAGILSASKAN
ncbi:MAG: hypothetical protein KBC15_00710 [Candidatus Levybacteria bacterium]|nr:hypothetical protein [Candidatus Levybacteria bacterium]